MTLIDHAELPFGNIDQVYVHVFRSEEQVLFVLTKLDALDIFCQEGAQIILLVEEAVSAIPNSQIAILGA